MDFEIWLLLACQVQKAHEEVEHAKEVGRDVKEAREQDSDSDDDLGIYLVKYAETLQVYDIYIYI
tara:strand:+ start:311 stop:505 length:195 start_codon:yes stop_codon:yes gene_type:complete